jgi:hypothetical protein
VSVVNIRHLTIIVVGFVLGVALGATVVAVGIDVVPGTWREVLTQNQAEVDAFYQKYPNYIPPTGSTAFSNCK